MHRSVDFEIYDNFSHYQKHEPVTELQQKMIHHKLKNGFRSHSIPFVSYVSDQNMCLGYN